MSNETKHEIVYQVSGQDVKLSPSIISQFITKGKAEISMTEAVNFMQLCKYAELNPFLNEAYLIKYAKDKPADMVVSKEAFMKRANRQEAYNGFNAGIIIENADGELNYNVGQFITSKQKLLGGWAEVYRKDIDHAFRVEVSLEEYHTHQSTWNKMPANMIRKVALVNAMREAFPEALGAMYTEDEPSVHELEQAVADQTDEKVEELLSDFNPVDDQEPKKTAEKIAEEVTENIKESNSYDERKAKMEGVQEDLFEGLTTNPKGE